MFKPENSLLTKKGLLYKEDRDIKEILSRIKSRIIEERGYKIKRTGFIEYEGIEHSIVELFEYNTDIELNESLMYNIKEGKLIDRSLWNKFPSCGNYLFGDYTKDKSFGLYLANVYYCLPFGWFTKSTILGAYKNPLEDYDEIILNDYNARIHFSQAPLLRDYGLFPHKCDIEREQLPFNMTLYKLLEEIYKPLNRIIRLAGEYERRRWENIGKNIDKKNDKKKKIMEKIKEKSLRILKMKN